MQQTQNAVLLTQAFWKQIANKFIVVSDMKNAVYTWGHQLLLSVSKVTHHIFRHKDDAPLSVDNKEKAIQSLNEGDKGWKK